MYDIPSYAVYAIGRWMTQKFRRQCNESGVFAAARPAKRLARVIRAAPLLPGSRNPRNRLRLSGRAKYRESATHLRLVAASRGRANRL